MAEYRLKIKVGEHEFEAEGPVETVQAQFVAFTELVSSLPSKTEKPREQDVSETPADNAENQNQNGNTAQRPQLDLERIMRVDGRAVSLTVRPNSATDAVLLLLLGHRQLRSTDSVGGTEIAEGLRESGQPTVRPDRVTDRLTAEGAVITVGAHRSRRYRLTNVGMARAQEIARGYIALLP